MITEPSGTRTVLFAIPHEGYLRNFVRLIAELIDQGYTVHVALDPNRRKDAPKGSYERCVDLGVTFLDVDPNVPLRSRVGQWINTLLGVEVHVRHSRPEDPAAIRAFRRAGPLGSKLARREIPSRLRLSRALHWSRRDIRNIFQRHRYHIVFVSPAVEFGSDAWEWIDAARRKSVLSALLVASWDNLTNKSTLGNRPDWVLVWSDSQGDEAYSRHGVARERIKVVGALVLSWHLGVKAGKPKSDCHVIYAGSSAFLSNNEVSHFQTWWRTIREDPDLRMLPVIVRLHPNGKMSRRDVDSVVAGDPLTQVFGPDVPDNSQSEIEFAEQLDSAVALVGINTSAFVDARIRGVPSLALDLPGVSAAQTHSEHFRSLVKNGGVELTSIERHISILTKHYKNWPNSSAQESMTFRHTFVFPNEPTSPEASACEFIEQISGEQSDSCRHDPSSLQLTALQTLVAGILWLTDGSLSRARSQLSNSRKRLRGARDRLRRRVQNARCQTLARSSSTGSEQSIRQRDISSRTKQPLTVAPPDWKGTFKAAPPSASLNLTHQEPSILGPWTGEVGYELLYWTPLIDHLVKTGHLTGAIPVSRGGTNLWYPEPLRNKYMELFNILSPADYQRMVRDRQDKGKGLKGITADAWDAIIMDRFPATTNLGLSQFQFFQFLKPYVYGRAPLKELLSMLSFSKITKPSGDLPGGVKAMLPDRFVAVALYNRPTLNTKSISAQDWNFLKAWCAGLPMVDIGTGLNLDDHSWEDLLHGQIPRPLYGCAPERNLAWQTDLVCASSALLSTHGGTAYLGLRCGKDVLAIQQKGTWIAPVHTAVAQHAARDCGASFSIALV